MCSIVRGGSDTPWERHMAGNPIDEHLGARIRMRRIMLHLSQRTLAGALGISLHQVRQYEDGADRISASELAPLRKLSMCRRNFSLPTCRERGAERDSKSRR